MKKAAVCLFLMFFIAGCAPAILVPETPKQKIGYCYTILYGIYTKADEYYSQGLITKEVLAEIVNKGLKVELILEAVSPDKEVDVTTAYLKATEMLIQLNNYLIDKKIGGN